MFKLTRLGTLVLGAAVGLGLISPATSSAATTFTDIQIHWAKAQIQSWVDEGLVKGYSGGYFKPNNEITRAEFFTLVNKSRGYSEQSDKKFTDVKSGQWYEGEVSKAAAAGYVSGYEDGSIRPSAPITRQEVAVIMKNVLNLDQGDQNALQIFKDSFPTWSKASIQAVVSKGYMKGYPDQTFKPNKTITRAEAVTALDQVRQSKPVETTPEAPVVQKLAYDQAGTFGPQMGTQTLNGNVTISAKDVILKNTTITGNLTITENVGEGNVTLENVQVRGLTTVLGGGMNSIYVKDSLLAKTLVNKKSGKIRLVASGNTKITNIVLESGAKIEGKTQHDNGFTRVTVSENMPSNSTVTLTGTIGTVDVEASRIKLELLDSKIETLTVNKEAKDVKVETNSSAKVKELILHAVTQVTGAGVIDESTEYVKGSTFEKEPAKREEKSSGAAAGGGGPGGAVTPAPNDTTPTATNMSLAEGLFSEAGTSGTVTISKTAKILNLTADINVDSKVTITEVLDASGGKVSLAGMSTAADVTAGKGRNINVIQLLNLSIFDGGGDGISASHFSTMANGSDTGTFTIKFRLTSKENSAKFSDYTLTVNVVNSL